MKMVREDLVFEVRSLINRAKKEGIPVKKDGIHLLSDNGAETVTLEIVPLRTSSPDPYFLVLFHETSQSKVAQQQPTVTHDNRKVAG